MKMKPMPGTAKINSKFNNGPVLEAACLLLACTSLFRVLKRLAEIYEASTAALMLHKCFSGLLY